MLLVDGSALLYRAFYKVEARVSLHISGGTWNRLQRTRTKSEQSLPFWISSFPPPHLAPHSPGNLFWTYPGPTFRKEMYSGYKKNRSPMPDGLRCAIPLVELLKSLRPKDVQGGRGGGR